MLKNKNNLVRLLLVLGQCNLMKMRPVDEINLPGEDFYYDALESQAEKITGDLAEVFVDGEDIEIDAIVAELDCLKLHYFLNCAFDGHLSHLIYFN